MSDDKRSVKSDDKPVPYQSPITLCCENIDICQTLNTSGKNRGAKYNDEDQIFEVRDIIILEVGSTRYQLDEYHFHIPGEHKICGDIYDAELHYVFVELKCGEDCLNEDRKCSNICNGKMPEDRM